MRSFFDPFLIPSSSAKMKEGSLGGSSFDHEVSETFLVGQRPAIWLGSLVSQRRLKWFIFGLIFLFLVLGGRLFHLQILEGPAFRGLAEGNRLRWEFIASQRGIFFDRFGVPLVENVATFSLLFYPSEFRQSLDAPEQLQLLLAPLALTENQISDLLKNDSYLPVAVKENLSYEQALDLMIKVQPFSYLEVVVDPQRKYRGQSALAHLLGYTSRITPEEKDDFLKKGYQLTEKVGRTGLEEYYQEILRGIPGQREIEIDAYGQELKVIAEQAPASGQNLVLSIDAGLQEAIYQSLKARLPRRGAAVVALDPRSGQLRALVSWPTFDNNQFSSALSEADYQSLIQNSLHPLFNRAIAGEYPSGSTIKLIIGLAALKEGLISKNSYINSVGGVWYDQWFFPDWKSGGHGYTNIIKALAESVNTFFYYLALEEFDGHQGLGLAKIVSYFTRFGLGEPLGINLPGERPGFVPTTAWKEAAKNEPWYPGDTLHLVIGQGDLLVTPLQVAAFTAAVANGGTLYRPQLVEKMVSADGEETGMPPIIIRENIASVADTQVIKEGMRSAVTAGSARGLGGLGATVAAKTGTAESPGENKLPHAWLTAFLPADDPELVLTVLVENGGEGSEAAAPIAREVFDWYIKNRLTLN